jgi:hypothetical protein
MAYHLHRCAACGHLTESRRYVCRACSRAAPGGGAWGPHSDSRQTRLAPADVAAGLALPAASILGAALYAQLLTLELWPRWYASLGLVADLRPSRFLLGALILGTPIGLLFVAAVAVLRTAAQSRLSLLLPNWPFPVRGRWLRYLLAALLPVAAALIGANAGAAQWQVLPGFWLCLALGLWRFGSPPSGGESDNPSRA